MHHIKTIISGTGSFIPENIIHNHEFIDQRFFEKDNSVIDSSGEEVIRKFRDITGIRERRWVNKDQNNSQIGLLAARQAIESAGIDPETLDQIIVAHNFGDVFTETIQTDIVPSLASRIKHLLGIKNPACIPYDIIFGCPGWIQGIIQADSFIRSGMADRCLIIGTETLSRVVDVYDRDTMIFSDGAGAAILEKSDRDDDSGILSTAAVSHTSEELGYLFLGKSNEPESDPNIRYIKMHGRKVYEYSLSQVPLAMKTALDRSGISIDDVKKILIHQANEKMDEAIIQRFYRLYGKKANPAEVMPMNISELGNSSVATVPTLYDMILNNRILNHRIEKGDILLFASVGAGMNINSFVYRQ